MFLVENIRGTHIKSCICIIVTKDQQIELREKSESGCSLLNVFLIGGNECSFLFIFYFLLGIITIFVM